MSADCQSFYRATLIYGSSFANPQKRTLELDRVMSALCQKRTFPVRRTGSIHPFDVVELPTLVEPRLQCTIETEDHKLMSLLCSPLLSLRAALAFASRLLLYLSTFRLLPFHPSPRSFGPSEQPQRLPSRHGPQAAVGHTHGCRSHPSS